MQPSVYRSTIYNSQDMETTSMSINRMNKEDSVHVCVCVCVCVYTHTQRMEYYSDIQRMKYMPFEATWVELEIIMLSNENQKEKGK